MLRTIIIIIFVYLCLRVIKDLFLRSVFRSNRFTYRPAETDRAVYTGEMVQDPVCQVYISEHDALTATVSGQIYFFCSRECMEKFREGKG